MFGNCWTQVSQEELLVSRFGFYESFVVENWNNSIFTIIIMNKHVHVHALNKTLSTDCIKSSAEINYFKIKLHIL